MSKGSGVKGKTMFQLERSTGASQRKAKHAERSPQEQLALLNDRPGASTHEREKLAQLIRRNTTQEPGAEKTGEQQPSSRRRTHRGHRASKPDTDDQ